MKKLIFFVVLLISFFVPCFSYSSKKNIKDSDTDVVEGYAKFYGNEPFSYLGITTEDEVFYRIVATEEIVSEISDNQGVKIRFFGKHLENSIENVLLFEVKKIETKIE